MRKQGKEKWLSVSFFYTLLVGREASHYLGKVARERGAFVLGDRL